MILDDNRPKEYKLYSIRAITSATFLGGPLAAGYLIGENYRNLDKPDEGRNALLIGIGATILLFSGIFLVPENILDKFPNTIIPAIYSGVVYYLVDKLQGPSLEQHKENERAFFSGWRAAGIGLASCLITLAILLGGFYLTTDNEVYDKYDIALAEFSSNEDESMKVFEQAEFKSNATLLRQLKGVSIPLWEENIKIIEGSNSISNLPIELADRNRLLLQYSKLRLEAFQLMKKAIEGDTNAYDDELDELGDKIEDVLARLQ